MKEKNLYKQQVLILISFSLLQILYTNANYTVTTDDATYVITKKQVTKPAEDTTVFTYNGSAQTYSVATSSDYTITGDTTKTNAGSNDITIALVDKTNTEWTTGGTADVVYTFTIAKKAVTLDFYDSDDEEPWHLTFVATYPDSLYYIPRFSVLHHGESDRLDRRERPR